MDNTVICFLKDPAYGNAKSRIAVVKGNDVACEIYAKLVHYTITLLNDIKVKRVIFFADTPIFNDFYNGFEYEIQKGSDLGERMLNAISQELCNSKKVVLIGSDCPYITKEILNQAFDALDVYDVVIGPSTDGGYYLIGVKEAHKSLFLSMQWSTPHVFTNTILRAEGLGLKWKSFPLLSDIDYWEDWVSYINTKTS